MGDSFAFHAPLLGIHLYLSLCEDIALMALTGIGSPSRRACGSRSASFRPLAAGAGCGGLHHASEEQVQLVWVISIQSTWARTMILLPPQPKGAD
jgi:hypothetical protein